MDKLRQANPIKFYFGKYFFLGFGLLQWAVAVALSVRFGNSSKNLSATFIFISLGCIFLVLFFFITERMRRVAVSKSRIVVIEGKKNLRVEWPDVKSIDLVPVFHIYKLKIKGRKHPVYFFPSRNIEPAYDLLAEDTSKMGDIVNKRKKKLGI